MNFLFKKSLVKMNYLMLLLLTIVSIYFFILISTYLFQRNLLYHPGENNYSGDKLTVEIEKVNIKTKDNIDLLSWYHNKHLNSHKTILFLHGNVTCRDDHRLRHKCLPNRQMVGFFCYHLSIDLLLLPIHPFIISIE